MSARKGGWLSSQADHLELAALGGGRPEHSKRARDLFPLPELPRLTRDVKLSRRSAQRWDRKIRVRETTNEAIRGLNWLAGKSDFLHGTDGAPDSLQQEVLQRIQILANMTNDIGSFDKIPSPEAALAELLKGRSDYQQSAAPIALAPYSLERVSLPESLHGLPDAVDLLPPDARRYLEGKELMLRDDQPDETPPPYWDPVLARSKRHYKEFIRKLDSIGLLQYTQSPKNQVGLFFVHKSDGKRIRLIIDARSTNVMFKEPPGVELCSSEGFSRIECELSPSALPGTDDFVAELASLNIHIGLSDVKDCFHRLRQPKWLAEYFCLKPIRASWVGLQGQNLDGKKLKANDIVYPMPGSLCMGFSWSLFFSQKINEYQCSLTKTLACSTLIQDKGEPVVFKSEACRGSDSQGIRHYVYVDNLGVLSPHQAVVSTALEELDGHFGSTGLLLHPGEVSCGGTKALGTVLNGKTLCSHVSPERFHRVRQSIRGLLRRKKFSGQTLEIVTGHATFCGLNNRMLLAVFHNTYKFIRRHYYEAAVAWDSVIEESQAFAGLMIFLRSDWWRPWNELVCCSDASTTGFGVCTSFWKKSEVAAVGRVKERSRFRRTQNHSARESSLTSAGFVRDELTGQWKAGEIESDDFLSLSGWALVDDFPEVPARFLRKDQWTPVRWGKWKHKEDILTLEARAAVMALKRVAMSVFGGNVRQLFLLDNMSLVLALERSRSRRYTLLKQVRIFNAYCISRGIQPSFRWVPSELNNADEPSRYDTDEPSKLLTDLIHDGSEAHSAPGHPLRQEEPEHCKENPGPGARTRDGEDWNFKGDLPLETNEQRSQLHRPCRNSSGQETRARGGQGGGRPIERGRKLQLRQQLRCDPPDRQKEETPSLPSQTSQEEVCRLFAGRKGHESLESVGAKGHRNGHREDLPERVRSFHELCKTQVPQPRQLGPGGSSACRLHEPPVPKWAPSLRWGQADCQLDPSPPSVWTSWISPHAAGVTGSQRVAQAVPRAQSHSIPFSSVVWDGSDAEADGISSHVGVPDDLPLYLLPPFSAVFPPGIWSCPASNWCDGLMERASQCRGTWGAFKDGGVRCLDLPEQPLPEGMGPYSFQSAQERPTKQKPVELRLWPILGGIQEGLGPNGVGSSAIPYQTQRSEHRPQSRLEVPPRGSEARSVEDSKIRGPLREVSQTCQDMGASPKSDQGLLPSVRGSLRGRRERPQKAAKLCFPQRSGKGQYVADLFSGKGGVAAACEKLGFVARQWDIKYGHQCDLTNRKVLRALHLDVKNGKVLAVMMAPPCDSFSVARDRTKVIRTCSQPWGVSRALLTPAEQQKIAIGNACFRRCAALIRVLDAYSIPWVLENPSSSKCWNLPFLQRLVQSEHTCLLTTDFCAYGTIWRKRTNILAGNIPLDDLHRVDHRCSGRRCCEFTHKPHFHLTGKGPGGENWTAIAQPYPPKLCSGLAYALTARWHYNTISY